MHRDAAVTGFLMLLLLGAGQGRCPRRCSCDFDAAGRKAVTCTEGGLKDPIPVMDMDSDAQVLTITAPEDSPNLLTVGPIFQSLTQLEEIHITRSGVPAIGENSFWGLRHLKALNLTNNNITLLMDSHLRGMRDLQALHLDDNNIDTIASATFMSLESLRVLTLARNKVMGLTPRMFLLLANLRTLDLSHNPIRDLDPEVLKDLPSLTILRCASCELTMVRSLVYKVVPSLELLDLRDNRITSLAPEEYLDLRSLKKLLLDGNQIYELKDYTFKRLALQHLSLSRNGLEKISRMAFEDGSVLSLDLSSNRFPYSSLRHLSPIITHLHHLNLGGNLIDTKHIRELLKRAVKLRSLTLSSMRMNHIPPDMFTQQAKLEVLNISSNSLMFLPVDMLHSLPSLRVLDVRRNEFRGLPEIILRRLDRVPHVYLDLNPWSCDQCHIPPLKVWLNNSMEYRSACKPDIDAPRCLKCHAPMDMFDKPIMEVDGLQLEPCPEGTFDVAAASASSTSSFSLVLAVVTAAVVVLLLLIILVVGIIMYNRHSAFYYTHEDDDNPHHFYDNPALHSDHTDITLEEDLDHLPDKEETGGCDSEDASKEDGEEEAGEESGNREGRKKKEMGNNTTNSKKEVTLKTNGGDKTIAIIDDLLRAADKRNKGKT